ncbi:hypothetical protein ACP275_07G082500 [Erythranthe tilingii]
MDCEKILSYKLKSLEFTTSQIEKKPYNDMINFSFSFTSNVSHPRLIRRLNYEPKSVTNYVFFVDREQFFRFEETLNFMEEELVHLEVDFDTRRKLVEYAWREALEALVSNRMGKDKVLKIHFDLSLQYRPREIANESSPRLVPAVDLSVHELTTVAVEYSGDRSLEMSCPDMDTSCPICFGGR